MKRINTALLALGAIFLAYLAWRVGWRDLWRQVGALGWGLLLIIGVEGLANVAHTLGWRHCIQAPKGQLSLWSLFRMNMAGWAINYLTPTASVGGEVSRAALLASNHKGSEAASSVLLDKLMTAVAHLLLVVLGAAFVFSRVSLPLQLWIAMGVTTVLLASGMTVFFLLQRYGKIGAVCRWLANHRWGGRKAAEAAQQLSKVDGSLQNFYRHHPTSLAWSILWHFIGHSAAIAQAWLFLSLIHQPTPLATVAAAGCLALWFDLLTFAIPMNLGTLEGSRVVVLKALGCQALLGMTFGVAVRAGQIFWACFGLASYAVFTARQGDPEMTPMTGEKSKYFLRPKKTVNKNLCLEE